MPTPLTEMAALARDYCGLIESLDQRSDGWLERLVHVLARLHAAVVQLAVTGEAMPAPMPPDLDRRFDLYSRLHRRLGALDAYWLEYDHALWTAGMTGSLADDLTDIYFDLKQGLDWLERQHPARAAWAWQTGYRQHWGQHLVDAERHLYRLKAAVPRPR